MSLQTIVLYVVLGVLCLFLGLSFLFYTMSQPHFYTSLFKAIVFIGCMVIIGMIFKNAKNNPNKIQTILNMSIYKFVWVAIGILTAIIVILQIISIALAWYMFAARLLVYYVYIFFIVLMYLPVYLIIVKEKTIEMLKFGIIPVVLLGLVVLSSKYVSFFESWKSTSVFYFAYVLYIYLTILALVITRHVNKIIDRVDAIITI